MQDSVSLQRGFAAGVDLLFQSRGTTPAITFLHPRRNVASALVDLSAGEQFHIRLVAVDAVLLLPSEFGQDAASSSSFTAALAVENVVSSRWRTRPMLNRGIIGSSSNRR